MGKVQQAASRKSQGRMQGGATQADVHLPQAGNTISATVSRDNDRESGNNRFRRPCGFVAYERGVVPRQLKIIPFGKVASEPPSPFTAERVIYVFPDVPQCKI